MSLSPGWAETRPQVLFPQERGSSVPSGRAEGARGQRGPEGQRRERTAEPGLGQQSLSAGRPGAGSRGVFLAASAAPGRVSRASEGLAGQGCGCCGKPGGHTWSRRGAEGHGAEKSQRKPPTDRVPGGARRGEEAREPPDAGPRVAPPGSPAWGRGERLLLSTSAEIMASPSVGRLLSLAPQPWPTHSQSRFGGFSFRRGKRKSPSRAESAGGDKRPLAGWDAGQPAPGLHGPSGVEVGVEVLLLPSKMTVCGGPFSLLENSFADGCLGHKAGEASLTQRGSLSFDPSETLPTGSPDASILLWTPSSDFTHFYTNDV